MCGSQHQCSGSGSIDHTSEAQKIQLAMMTYTHPLFGLDIGSS